MELPYCLFFIGFDMITEWDLDGETWSHRADMQHLLSGPFQRVIIIRTKLFMYKNIVDCSESQNKYSKLNSPFGPPYSARMYKVKTNGYPK